MPYSPEGHLIASIVRNGEMQVALANGVTSEMFHVHPSEWEWLENYFLRHKKAPSRIAFLSRFPGFRLVKTDDTAHFAEEVRKAHARHQLTEIMNEVADLVTEGDIELAVKKMHSGIITVAAGVSNVNDADLFTSYDDILFDADSRVHRVKSQGSSGIPSGLKTIDEDRGGYNPGELIIIAARLGEGKSWIMQHGAAVAAAAGYTVQFNALEQSRSQVAFRIHTLLSGSVGKALFRNTALMQGKNYDQRAYRAFLAQLAKTVPGKLHVSDTTRGRVSALTIAAQIERNKPDIQYIDYIGLMSRDDNDWQGMAKLSGNLKQIGVEYGIPIVAAAQLNRQNGLGKEPPDAEALALSDSIGQDADLVITSKLRSPSVLKMKRAKERNGIGGDTWWMEFRPSDGVIKECSFNRAQDLMDKDAEDRDNRSA